MGWDDSHTSIDDTFSLFQGRCPPRLTFTRPFEESAPGEMLEQFRTRFNSISSYFPEIGGEVRVGITTTYKGLAIMQTNKDSTTTKLCFPPLGRAGLPTRYVMGHEIMHVVQADQKGLPRTERSCDMFTISRLPARFIDHAPIYLRMPKAVRRNWSHSGIHPIVSTLAHDLALEAVLSRDRNPRYLSWWEKRFAEGIEGNVFLQDSLDEIG